MNAVKKKQEALY